MIPLRVWGMLLAQLSGCGFGCGLPSTFAGHAARLKCCIFALLLDAWKTWDTATWCVRVYDSVTKVFNELCVDKTDRRDAEGYFQVFGDETEPNVSSSQKLDMAMEKISQQGCSHGPLGQANGRFLATV